MGFKAVGCVFGEVATSQSLHWCDSLGLGTSPPEHVMFAAACVPCGSFVDAVAWLRWCPGSRDFSWDSLATTRHHSLLLLVLVLEPVPVLARGLVLELALRHLLGAAGETLTLVLVLLVRKEQCWMWVQLQLQPWQWRPKFQCVGKDR